MGCDIHLWTEKKVNGQWETLSGVNEPEINDYKSTTQKCKDRGESTEYWERRIKEMGSGEYDFIWSGRNYVLFSILAGVRNSHDIVPIIAPKGLPADVSNLVSEAATEWDGDGHSHTYLTVTELLAFDWEKGFVEEGWVDADNYKTFKEHGSPDSWSRSVGGGGVDHVTNYDMENHIAGNGEYWAFGRTPYTLVRWSISFKDRVGTFYTWSIPKLKELAGEDLDSVRIVFWFDN